MRIENTRNLIRDAIRGCAADSTLPVDEGDPAVCLTCSFQIEGVVLAHMVRQELPHVPVLFIDTGYHFREVYEYRDRIAADWNLNLINLKPKLTVTEQEQQFGILHQSAPDRCCRLRKVEPLFAALEAYDVWFTGRRREHSAARTGLQIAEMFGLVSGKQLRKINPLAPWSTAEIWEYAAQYHIPALPLYLQGYTSIGCEPCTAAPAGESDLRSGRWGGRKLECGIHEQADIRAWARGSEGV